jgi:hypothetical protein
MSGSRDTVLERVKVREVAGVFHSRDALDAAVDDLMLAGIERTDIDLMAEGATVREKLGGVYVAVEELPDVPQAPRRAFIPREDIVGPLAAAAGILMYIGAAAAAASVVASGGALALAAVGAGGAGLAALLTRSLGGTEAEALVEQLTSGGLVLWVRVRAPDQEEKIRQILLAHGAEAVRVHEIELEKRLEDVPLSSLLAEPVPTGHRSPSP